MSRLKPPGHPGFLRAYRILGGVCFFIAVTGTLHATDFLRGDANSDGVVSFADGHRILMSLFRDYAPPPCLDAADVNDDENINLTDGMVLMNYLVLGEKGHIKPPYINPGADPSGPEPNRSGRLLDCSSYGDGSRLDDPAAKLEILDAVAPGGDDPHAVLTIRLSSSMELAGYAGILETDVPLFGDQFGPKTDLTGLIETGYLASGTRGNSVHFGYLQGMLRDQPWIGPVEERPVLEITTCLLKGTKAGVYPLNLRAGELVALSSGQAIDATLSGGVLRVLEDLDDDVACEPPEVPLDCPLPAGDPASLEARYSLGDATGFPGTTVNVPFRIVANAEGQGFSLSLDYDEEVLEAVDVRTLYEKPDGTEYGFWKFEIDAQNQVPGSGGVDEGFVIAAAVFSFVDECNNLPANVESDVFEIAFSIKPEAEAGTTEIRFQDGAQGSGAPVRNVMAALGELVVPETAGSFLFVNGRVNVLPDGSFFIRGDTNQDGTVDISDPIATLNYLFTGTAALYCLDAADADDDGQLLITDAVRTLQFLFHGGGPLPPPTEKPGEDPTDDGLKCYSKP